MRNSTVYTPSENVVWLEKRVSARIGINPVKQTTVKLLCTYSTPIGWKNELCVVYKVNNKIYNDIVGDGYHIFFNNKKDHDKVNKSLNLVKRGYILNNNCDSCKYRFACLVSNEGMNLDYVSR